MNLTNERLRLLSLDGQAVTNITPPVTMADVKIALAQPLKVGAVLDSDGQPYYTDPPVWDSEKASRRWTPDEAQFWGRFPGFEPIPGMKWNPDDHINARSYRKAEYKTGKQYTYGGQTWTEYDQRPQTGGVEFKIEFDPASGAVHSTASADAPNDPAKSTATNHLDGLENQLKAQLFATLRARRPGKARLDE